MERVRYTIIGREIPNELWPEIFVAMTYISNLLSTSLLNGESLIKVSTQKVTRL